MTILQHHRLYFVLVPSGLPLRILTSIPN